MGSIEVLIDRANLGALAVNRCQIAIHFYGPDWPSKRENRALAKHNYNTSIILIYRIKVKTILK